MLKIAERLSIHGDSDVVPTEFDGMIAQIKKTNPARRNILDFRGKSITDVGDKVFPEMTRMIFDQGGEANKMFFPTILSEDIQDLCRNRIRFGTNDKNMTPVFDSYPTPMGTLKFGEGSGAGPDKMFRVKGPIATKGNADKKPNPPTFTAAAVTGSPGSKFVAADAGNYTYDVFAINKSGISTAAAAQAAVAVASGDGVQLTIKADVSKPGSGYIICRTAPGGSVTMEMVRIGRNPNGDTVFTDLNEDLPGTTELITITEKRLQTVAEFYQLLPLRLYRMNPTNRLVTPFILALWGALDLKVPEQCGIMKNIRYSGGLYNG